MIGELLAVFGIGAPLSVAAELVIVLSAVKAAVDLYKAKNK